MSFKSSSDLSYSVKHEDGDGGTGWEWVQGESLEALARDLEFVLVPWEG